MLGMPLYAHGPFVVNQTINFCSDDGKASVRFYFQNGFGRRPMLDFEVSEIPVTSLILLVGFVQFLSLCLCHLNKLVGRSP